MLFTQTTFIGVDPSGGRKPFTYAMLDYDCKLLALNEGEMEEVLAFVGGQRSAYVAVNAPSGPNTGLVKQGEARQTLAPLHRVGRAVDMRLAEHHLRQRGISVAGTPAQESLCPMWMQLGFAFYHKLQGMGFTHYAATEAAAPYQWLETHPHAAFCALLGQVPLPKPTLEGRLQRQLALYEQRINLKDPMEFFEEMTRHKLLHGTLPLDWVYPAEMLDALIAAYTAWMAARFPAKISIVGDAAEGQIVLPSATLKEKY